MDRRNLILGGIAATLLLVAILYAVTRPSASAKIPHEIKANCACLACRQHVLVSAEVTDSRPYECPECGERAAYPLLLCRDCGKYFVPNLERRGDGELPSMPIMPSCTACGSRNVGAYSGTEMIPAEELVLPPWPQ
jgi:DNA-directed RNA polymerase subunit RPC12/RpoP